jgi:hypothetical protein
VDFGRVSDALVKDHNKKDKWGQYPTCLVIPATNFTSAFPKLGYLGIKKISYDAKINYMAKTIIQASHAKDQLERLHINKKNNTVFSSLDIESFYPSVTYSLVETTTNYFSKNLPMKEILMI